MQDTREVAVAVDGASLCYDDYETNHSKGHSEPEETAAWQRALPPPDPARESDTRPLAVESLKPGTGALVSVVRDEEELLLAGRTRPLWPHLAAAAALMLALEMLLLSFWRSSRRFDPQTPQRPQSARETATSPTSPAFEEISK